MDRLVHCKFLLEFFNINRLIFFPRIQQLLFMRAWCSCIHWGVFSCKWQCSGCSPKCSLYLNRKFAKHLFCLYWQRSKKNHTCTLWFIQLTSYGIFFSSVASFVNFRTNATVAEIESIKYVWIIRNYVACALIWFSFSDFFYSNFSS